MAKITKEMIARILAHVGGAAKRRAGGQLHDAPALDPAR
ncbi:hypothetical protein OB910_18800 [Klebsiella pneumoniae]|nr:hypothetical protein [Klebsiella pneumoniae]